MGDELKLVMVELHMQSGYLRNISIGVTVLVVIALTLACLVACGALLSVS